MMKEKEKTVAVTISCFCNFLALVTGGYFQYIKDCHDYMMEVEVE